MKNFYRLAGFILLFTLAGCSTNPQPGPAVPLPPEKLPTYVAQTVEAGRRTQVASNPVSSKSATATGLPASPGTPAPAASRSLPITSTPAATRPAVAQSSTLTVTSSQPLSITASPGAAPDPTATRSFIASPTPRPSPTIVSSVPDAAIQISRPGDQSKVASPFLVLAAINQGAVGNVRIELFGEDGRLLVRQVKKYPVDQTTYAHLTLQIEFEIAAAAEAGRLVISSEDDQGRLIAVNSVDLNLLSIGDADINPSSAMLEAIVIQQPAPKVMVQGGTLLVSGLAMPSGTLPLMVKLVTAEGAVVGQRQVAVNMPSNGGYGSFAVEVPYNVNALAPVLLQVYEPGDGVSPIRHLASAEIMLGP